MDKQKVIEHAENVIRKIDEFNDSEISKDDLKIVKEKIQFLIDSLNQKSLGSENHQHFGLGRLVIDQWPLGHKLGIDIKNLEEEYMALYNLEELAQLVIKALRMANERLRKSPEWQTLQVIQKQLIAIEEDLKNQGKSKDELKKRINIGLIAAREFEADDPDFADILQKIDYRYKKL